MAQDRALIIGADGYKEEKIIADNTELCTNTADVISLYDAVYISGNNNVGVASATSRHVCVGLAITIIDSTNCQIITSGVLEGFSSSMTYGDKYYLGEAGALTTTEPAAGTAQLVGYAWNATDLLVQIQQPRERWEYPAITSPTGTDADMVCCYQFNALTGDTSDQVDRKNSHDLTWVSGATRKGMPVDGLRCWSFGNDSQYTAAGHANLRLLGAMTVEILLANDGYGAYRTIVECSSPGAGEADNVLYSVRLANYSRLRWISEKDTKSMQTIEYQAGINGQLYLLTLSRAADNTSLIWFNGVPAVFTGTWQTPTGGGNSQLRIGCDEDSNNHFYGQIAGLRIFSAAFTDAHALASYQQMRGL